MSVINLHLEDRIAVVTIDAPARSNALDDSALADFDAALSRLADARGLIITGSGTRTFCAGYDLRQLGRGSIETTTDNAFPRLANRVAGLPLLTIAALNGPAVGAGAHLALACDLRIGVSEAFLALPAAKLGIVYDPQAIARMASELGMALARQLLVAALPIPAETLACAGIYREIIPAQQLMVRAREIARKAAELAPLSVAGMKRILNRCGACATEIELFRQIQLDVAASHDASEGRAAIRERRPPRFTGR